MCFSITPRQAFADAGFRRTATTSWRQTVARPTTVGPFVSFTVIGSGPGSSPALIRTTINAARRRASSAVITPWRPTVTRFPSLPPARVCTT